MMMPHGQPLNGAEEFLQSQRKQLVQPAPLLKEPTGLTELLPDAPFPASEQELGLEETQKLPGEKATLYFRLTDSGITVNEKTPYFIDLELDSRKDVLILPEKAISFVDEKPIVYCLAETGILEIRYIEIGLTANGYVEILSGLTEGDTVIQR